jgi:hypothetical protein
LRPFRGVLFIRFFVETHTSLPFFLPCVVILSVRGKKEKSKFGTALHTLLPTPFPLSLRRSLDIYFFPKVKD